MTEIAKVHRSLTTAEDMRKQTKLQMQPYANWEEYLTPAPLSIAILGELVYISSSDDFSLNKNPPVGGYKYIKYPDSFRACLMQVCNSGWRAFNEAHKSMDQIRLHTYQVPQYMKNVVKILFEGTDEVVQACLPGHLENISNIADECVRLSGETEKQFTYVINIIQELLEACVNAKQFYGEEWKELMQKQEEAKLREKSAQEANTRTQTAMIKLEKELEQAQHNYQKAMDSLPTGWEMIGMDFVKAITQSITCLVDGVTCAVSNRVSKKYSYTDTVSQHEDEGRDQIGEITAYSKSFEILTYLQTIKKEMRVNNKDDEIAWTNLYDQKKEATKSDHIEEQLKRISDGLEKNTDCTAKTQAQDLCKKGIEICQSLAKFAPDGKCDEDNSKKIIGDVLDLINSAVQFDCKSKDNTKSPAISAKPPMMSKEENKSGSFSQMVAENARLQIEQTRAQMNKTRESYEKCVENLEINQKELTEILVTMRNCDLKTIDFKTTINMLVKGMEAMGRVKVQWEKMVHFFQMVSNLVKTSLSTTLKNVVRDAENIQNLSYNAKLFSKDMLYTQAFQACNIASLVNMISDTYVDVSNKYLMDRISSLGKLMTMDINNPEFMKEINELRDACDDAQGGIKNLVLKNKKDFDKKSKARFENINRQLHPILPDALPEDIKSIKAAVEAGFSEADEDQYC
ncbi:uncharacterized protein LOC130550271 [Triplophysa rosa]|uniref:Uncharacterized protein n=1 Tax=Triplophysa rosa TaxID=992332 RepID=A0A9W7T228_TRIRA|nr:uncharacterized protein LOC130550271 [Triplophysa rosa]XP_057183686.1 uncharacterized protein LOC130550271 [Triplophysa rosa]KAI7789373.1 hypothetical protein IRJ41_013138 [Triplophysa rosa]